MKKKIIILTIILLLVTASVGSLILFNNSKNSKNTDALKFKEEYESLNNTVREGSDKKYQELTIPEDNPMVYIDITEALKILASDEKAIIYVGANWCPWCRNAVPVMIDAAMDLNINKVYYLNIDDEKSTFEIKDGKLVETKHGTDEYYKLLDELESHLNDYILTDADNNKYDTLEKRIYMPFVFTVKNKEVTSTHLSTVDLEEGQTSYDNLTSKQYDELYNIYYEMFDNLYSSNNVCSKENCN